MLNCIILQLEQASTEKYYHSADGQQLSKPW